MNAFILRISPSGVDKISEALESDHIIIGWAYAAGLLDNSLDWIAFRQIISDAYYSAQETMHKAGNAGGHMWRFIRDMKIGDLVVVPYGSEFYVAEITGDAKFLPEKQEDDTSYRRPVKWLNDKKAISRTVARSALLSRMKTQGTTADASDLVEEVLECLDAAKTGHAPTFMEDLKSRLIRESLAEMRSGRIESYGFEALIQTTLLGLGAVSCRIVPRNLDKGADLLATFRVAGAFQLLVAVQAKHWNPEPPVGRDTVEQLIRGIEAEGANLGIVITSGTISKDASDAAAEYFEAKGIRIELVDGDQFAKLIIEHGFGAGM